MVLKAQDCWLITKKPQSNEIQIPPGECRVLGLFYCVPSERPIFWDVLTCCLVTITHYNFEISLLNCELGSSGPLRYLLNLNFSGLKYLRLYFENSFLRNPYGFPMNPKILERLQNLPNLENFLLDKSYCSSSSSAFRALMRMLGSRPEIDLILSILRYITWRLLLRIHSMTNVPQKLRDKQWPQLHHLNLRSLNTTVADFPGFYETTRRFAQKFPIV